MSEIIAYTFDDDGKKHEVSMIDVYQTMMDMIKVRYFDYMVRNLNSIDDSSLHLDRFKGQEMRVLEHMINFIHDTYQDHVEGARRDVLGSKGTLDV